MSQPKLAEGFTRVRHDVRQLALPSSLDSRLSYMHVGLLKLVFELSVMSKVGKEPELSRKGARQHPDMISSAVAGLVVTFVCD